MGRGCFSNDPNEQILQGQEKGAANPKPKIFPEINVAPKPVIEASVQKNLFLGRLPIIFVLPLNMLPKLSNSNKYTKPSITKGQIIDTMAQEVIFVIYTYLITTSLHHPHHKIRETGQDVWHRLWAE